MKPRGFWRVYGLSILLLAGNAILLAFSYRNRNALGLTIGALGIASAAYGMGVAWSIGETIESLAGMRQLLCFYSAHAREVCQSCRLAGEPPWERDEARDRDSRQGA